MSDLLCSRSASPGTGASCQMKRIVPGASRGGAAALGAQNSGAHCPSFRISPSFLIIPSENVSSLLFELKITVWEGGFSLILTLGSV